MGKTAKNAPTWAREKAMALQNTVFSQTFSNAIEAFVEAFGRYIAEHEQPPVSPEVAATMKIMATLCSDSEVVPGSWGKTADFQIVLDIIQKLLKEKKGQ